MWGLHLRLVRHDEYRIQDDNRRHPRLSLDRSQHRGSCNDRGGHSAVDNTDTEEYYPQPDSCSLRGSHTAQDEDMKTQRKLRASIAGKHAYQHQRRMEEDDETLVYPSHMVVSIQNRPQDGTRLSHPRVAKMLNDANGASTRESDLRVTGRS